MPIRHGNPYRALGWLVGIILWLSATPALAPPEKTEDRAYAQPGTSQPEKTLAPQQEVPVDIIPAAEPISSGGTNSSDAQDPAGDAETKKQRSQADLKAQQDMALWAKWMVVVSAISVLIAGMAVFLVYLTLREAGKTTKVAKTALTVTRITAERQLRAYVFMEAAQINNFALGEKIQILFVVKNFGQTPADRVSYWAETCFSGGESNKPPIRQSRSGGDWGPGASVRIVLTREDIWGQDADAIAVVSGAKTMWIYGEIHYSDKFGGDQTTTFRYSYQGNGVMPPEKVLKLYYTPEGNKAT